MDYMFQQAELYPLQGDSMLAQIHSQKVVFLECETASLAKKGNMCMFLFYDPDYYL